MRLLIILLGLLGPASALAQTCAQDPVLCPSPTYNNVKVGNPSGAPSAFGDVNISGTYLVNGVAVTPPGAPGLNNIQAFACGVTIDDGNVHTVSSAPATSCFAGKTTLAQLAAITINGTTPFAFLTDNGTVTGPLCTTGSSTNCFLNGAYNLTNASVPGMDIAWLAIQAALLTQKVYIPTGQYVIGSTEPLPLLVPIATELNVQTYGPGDQVQGDGPRLSVLFAGSSFGTLSDGVTMIPLMSCGDPGATPTNQLGRWAGANGQCSGIVSQIGLWGNPALATGISSTYQTDGLAFGARLAATDVFSQWFRHNYTIVGDHTMRIRVHSISGVVGMYWPSPNTVLAGDNAFIDFYDAGASMYGQEVDGNASLSGTFEGETYWNGGLATIWGDNNACQPIVYNAQFRNLFTEFMGVNFVTDGHVWNGSVYNDTNKCRGLREMNIDKWFGFYQNAQIPVGTLLRRRATIDVATISGRLLALSVNGGNPMPVADNSGAAGIAFINAATVGDTATGIGLRMEGAMTALFAAGVGQGISGATIPIFNSTIAGGAPGGPGLGASWSQPDGSAGIFAYFVTQGNYGSTVVGDVMEFESNWFNTVYPGGFVATQPVAGIVQQASVANGIVPLQTSGGTYISSGANALNSGFSVKASGISGRTTFVPGTGGTNGTFAWTATGGGCSPEPSGHFVVAGGVVTAFYPDTTTGAGCTSQPAVTLTGSAGLSGASGTVLWPGANATATTTDGLMILGKGMAFGSGPGSSLGNNLWFNWLTRIQ